MKKILAATMAMTLVASGTSLIKKRELPASPQGNGKRPRFVRIPTFPRLGGVSHPVRAVLTFYTAGPESTGKRPGAKGYGITHSGLPVGLGIAAADPRFYPAGTLIQVGDRYYLVADTGALVRGWNRFDLYLPEVHQARELGVRIQTVQVFR